MSKWLVRISVIIIIFLTIVTIFACQLPGDKEPEYPSTIGTFPETGNYAIDPETIIESLDHGVTNVFMPLLATPSVDTILPSGSIHWKQSDYLKVANALSQFVWKEPLDGWSIYHLDFNKECQDNPSGFDSANIIYYKTIGVGWQKMYTARWIQIFPLAAEVAWGSGKNFPISDGWNAINLTKFKITADDALRIAEENGGKEARSRVGNGCSILINARNHNKDDRWDLGYYYGVNFEMIIDPYSGKHEFPTPIP